MKAKVLKPILLDSGPAQVGDIVELSEGMVAHYAARGAVERYDIKIVSEEVETKPLIRKPKGKK